jgi:hypothetical protein
MPVPNAEQTASIFSLAIYSFLDPIVFLAYRVPHLAHDQLPPLADYDYARHLTEKSFPVCILLADPDNASHNSFSAPRFVCWYQETASLLQTFACFPKGIYYPYIDHHFTSLC